jgi:ATP-dependent Zn protease
VSLKSFDIPQKWFESRVSCLEEVRRRPELPLAMHEAGQAFAYEFNDISLRISSLEKTTRIINGEPVVFAGSTEPAPAVQITKYNLWQHVVCIMAGVAAQHVIDGQGAMNNAAADMQRAAECIEQVGLNGEQADELIIAAAKAGANIIMKNIATVRAIADLLEQKKRIDGNEIREIIRQQKDGTIRL